MKKFRKHDYPILRDRKEIDIDAIDEIPKLTLVQMEELKELKRGWEEKAGEYRLEDNSIDLFCINISEIQLMAQQGDPQAQFLLGMSYEYGDDVDENIDLAYKWYVSAAEKNHITAMSCLGDLLYMNTNYEMDIYRALQWYIPAAILGDIYSRYIIGNIFFYGEGVEKNYREALNWYVGTIGSKEDSCYQNSALEKIMEIYYKGLGVKKDVEKALFYHEIYANCGHHSEKKYIADMYYEGIEVPRRAEKYIPLYEEMSEFEDSEAEYRLADIYYHGIGVEANEKKALEWYERAFFDSTNRIKGHIFLEGKSKNIKSEFTSFVEMFEYYNSKANNGEVKAQYRLSGLYYRGYGTSVDTDLGYIWLLKAAENGDIDAQYELAERYHYGEGVEESLGIAFQWYMKAAEQGDEMAQFQVGEFYYHGDGTVVPIDYEKAIFWYRKVSNLELAEFRIHDIFEERNR